MKILQFIFGPALFLACNSSATPWGLMGHAIIGSKDGELSICMPKNIPEGVRVRDISVFDRSLSDRHRALMWEAEVKLADYPMFLKPGGCISYGEELFGYWPLMGAKPLRAKETYSVRINLIVDNPARHDVLFYSAIFCVGARRDDQLVYAQYIYNSDGSVTRPSCLAAFD